MKKIEELLIVDPITTKKELINRDKLMKILDCTTSYISKCKRKSYYNSKIRAYILNSSTSVNEISEIISKHKIENETWVSSYLLPEYVKVSNYGRVARFFKNGKMRVYQSYSKASLKTAIVIKCPNAEGVPKETNKTRIVASAFLNGGEPLGSEQRVIHKSGNKWDDRVSNLEITDVAGSGRIGYIASKGKLSVPVAKVNPWNLDIVDVYPSMAKAAKENGLVRETVRLGTVEYPKSIYGRFLWKRLTKTQYEELYEELLDQKEIV